MVVSFAYAGGILENLILNDVQDKKILRINGLKFQVALHMIGIEKIKTLKATSLTAENKRSGGFRGESLRNLRFLKGKLTVR